MIAVLVACANVQPWELVYETDVPPLADGVRPDSVSLAGADPSAADPVLDPATAKARLEVRRGGNGHLVGLLRQYVPREPNGAEAAVASPATYTATDDGGAPVIRRHGTLDPVVAAAPLGDGLLALTCGASPPAILWFEGATSTFPGAAYGPPTDTWVALGLCQGETRLGVAAGDAFLVATDADVTRITPTATGLEAEPLGPPPAPLAEVVWLEDGAEGLESVSWAGAATWADASGATAEADLDGDPLADPVWRGADGDLRLATTAGLWRWAPPADPERIAGPPEPPVDAAWIAAGAGLRAIEGVPNEEAPGLSVPVAAAVALPSDDGWRVTEVPTTPCAEPEVCRGYGESEVLGAFGPVGAPIPVYDVWSWSAEERHETWASPK